MKFIIGKCSVVLSRQHATAIPADAVVNFVDSSFVCGGSTTDELYNTAGPLLLKKCKSIRSKFPQNSVPAGSVIMTSSYGLRAKYIMHCVVPQYSDSNMQYLLENCYVKALQFCKIYNLSSIVFPSVSIGMQYPIDADADIAFDAIYCFLKCCTSPINVVFSLPDPMSFSLCMHAAFAEIGPFNSIEGFDNAVAIAF